jgi:tetratricopeptide (TPR) repeat protein
MARRRFWFTNRVVLGLTAFLILTALWEFKWRPQYRGDYEEGVRLYESGKYLQAENAFDQAYRIAPNALGVIIMEGWTHLKLNRLEEARFYFNRAVRIDPRSEEAQLGLSFVALETGRGELDPALLARILQSRKDDSNVMILLAGAQERLGNYFQAAEIYSRLQTDKDYGETARLALQNIFGLSGFKDNAISAFPSFQRSSRLQVNYRAGDGALWVRTTTGDWSKFYVQGVDLGGTAPGYRPTSLPNEGAHYADWLNDASQLHVNTLRVYTLLPPAFYRAFHHYVADGGRLSLIQQIWVAEPDHQDLFQPGFEEQTKADIRYVVDAIHGRGQVPPKRTRGSGVYEFDLADCVSAYVLGRDMDPDVITRTNLLNAGKRSYDGKYLSVTNASPSEVWLVEMADYLLDYEVSTYDWQHPVAMVSGPAPDPAAAVLLEAKVKPKPTCVSGVFAAYPAFPFFPEYMEKNPRYANARDKEGPNPVYGFVRELRARLPVPLVVSEYGVSTSMEPGRILASGWNEGGYSDNRQAEALVRLTRALRKAGSAGALAFELADEWYREGWITEGFQTSAEKAALSLNDLDPAKRYGLIGYRTSKWQLFAGDPAVWEKEKRIEADAPPPRIGDGYDGERTLRALQIAADEGYLYFRLQVACLDCVGTTHSGKTHFALAAYALALNTLPGKVGIKALPFGAVNLAAGANFLLLLREPERSTMLVAESYNPFQFVPRADDPKHRQLIYKRDFTPSLIPTGAFQPLPLADNRSQMLYGQGNPAAPDYDSQAQWYADIKHSAILIRIPWGKLLITDPSSMQAFVSYDRTAGVRSLGMGGLQVSAYVLRPKETGELKDMAMVVALPANGPPEQFSWPKWISVKVEPFRKKAFFALAQEFARFDAGNQSTKPSRKASLANPQGVR